MTEVCKFGTRVGYLWAGEHGFAELPTALYGLFMAAVAYFILVNVLIDQEDVAYFLAPKLLQSS